MRDEKPTPLRSGTRSRFSDSHSRPVSVTLLAFGVLTIAGLNLIRLFQAIAQRQFIAALVPGLPFYQAGSGMMWGACGLALAWGLWQGRAWAGRTVIWAALAYLLYDWLDRLMLRKGASLTSWPFMAVVTALVLGYVFFTLSRPKVRAFFHLKDRHREN